uniref:RBD domain-containing protein n=1 Tax=Timema monikensis TaxID=170555 RepID=A0A7R9HN63_9NEOP|nr:unnamed protein product [Timema monikensis]
MLQVAPSCLSTLPSEITESEEIWQQLTKRKKTKRFSPRPAVASEVILGVTTLVSASVVAWSKASLSGAIGLPRTRRPIQRNPPSSPVTHLSVPCQHTHDAQSPLLLTCQFLVSTPMMEFLVSTPMMDLLVQVTTANKIPPGGHVIQAMGDRGVLPYKPSTPIGALDTWSIQVVAKSSLGGRKAPLRPSNQQPFEQTFRLQVHLPRNQLFVTRVSSKIALSDILSQVCLEKNLDPEKYELRHPGNLDQVLDARSSLADYKLQEVVLVARSTRPLSLASTDIMVLHREEEKRRQQANVKIYSLYPAPVSPQSAEGSISSDSLGGRSSSPTRSDESASRSASPPVPGLPPMMAQPPPRPQRKRRPAPKPPASNNNFINNNNNNSNNKTGDQQLEVGDHVLFKTPLHMLSPKHPRGRPTDRSESDLKTSVLRTPWSFWDTVDEVQPSSGSNKPGQGSEKDGGVIISHSRNSSDSSGYHEASVLSESPDSHAGPQGYQGPSDTLPRRSKLTSVRQDPVVVEHPHTLSRSLSSLAVNGHEGGVASSVAPARKTALSASTTALASAGQAPRKKRVAPPPPPLFKNNETKQDMKPSDILSEPVAPPRQAMGHRDDRLKTSSLDRNVREKAEGSTALDKSATLPTKTSLSKQGSSASSLENVSKTSLQSFSSMEEEIVEVEEEEEEEGDNIPLQKTLNAPPVKDPIVEVEDTPNPPLASVLPSRRDADTNLPVDKLGKSSSSSSNCRLDVRPLRPFTPRVAAPRHLSARPSIEDNPPRVPSSLPPSYPPRPVSPLHYEIDFDKDDAPLGGYLWAHSDRVNSRPLTPIKKPSFTSELAGSVITNSHTYLLKNLVEEMGNDETKSGTNLNGAINKNVRKKILLDKKLTDLNYVGQEIGYDETKEVFGYSDTNPEDTTVMNVRKKIRPDVTLTDLNYSDDDSCISSTESDRDSPTHALHGKDSDPTLRKGFVKEHLRVEDSSIVKRDTMSQMRADTDTCKDTNRPIPAFRHCSVQQQNVGVVGTKKKAPVRSCAPIKTVLFPAIIVEETDLSEEAELGHSVEILEEPTAAVGPVLKRAGDPSLDVKVSVLAPPPPEVQSINRRESSESWNNFLKQLDEIVENRAQFRKRTRIFVAGEWKKFIKKPPPVQPAESQTSIAPSSAVKLNTKLANYATEVDAPPTPKPRRRPQQADSVVAFPRPIPRPRKLSIDLVESTEGSQTSELDYGIQEDLNDIKFAESNQNNDDTRDKESKDDTNNEEYNSSVKNPPRDFMGGKQLKIITKTKRDPKFDTFGLKSPTFQKSRKKWDLTDEQTLEHLSNVSIDGDYTVEETDAVFVVGSMADNSDAEVFSQLSRPDVEPTFTRPNFRKSPTDSELEPQILRRSLNRDGRFPSSPKQWRDRKLDPTGSATSLRSMGEMPRFLGAAANIGRWNNIEALHTAKEASPGWVLGADDSGSSIAHFTLLANRKCVHICMEGECKTTLNRPDWDLNPGVTVISKTVDHESDSLDQHVSTLCSTELLGLHHSYLGLQLEVDSQEEDAAADDDELPHEPDSRPAARHQSISSKQEPSQSSSSPPPQKPPVSPAALPPPDLVPLAAASSAEGPLEVIDWEYQLPAPPTAFRDTNSPTLVEGETVVLADTGVFREEVTESSLDSGDFSLQDGDSFHPTRIHSRNLEQTRKEFTVNGLEFDIQREGNFTKISRVNPLFDAQQFEIDSQIIDQPKSQSKVSDIGMLTKDKPKTVDTIPQEIIRDEPHIQKDASRSSSNVSIHRPTVVQESNQSGQLSNFKITTYQIPREPDKLFEGEKEIFKKPLPVSNRSHRYGSVGLVGSFWSGDLEGKKSMSYTALGYDSRPTRTKSVGNLAVEVDIESERRDTRLLKTASHQNVNEDLETPLLDEAHLRQGQGPTQGHRQKDLSLQSLQVLRNILPQLTSQTPSEDSKSEDKDIQAVVDVIPR